MKKTKNYKVRAKKKIQIIPITEIKGKYNTQKDYRRQVKLYNSLTPEQKAIELRRLKIIKQ